MLRVGVLVEDAKRRDGDDPVFAQVTVWQGRAEELADRLPKGATVYIEGKAKVQAWKGQDGEPRATLDVSAWKVELLGAVGKQAPRSPHRERDRRPNAMPQQMALAGAGRNTRRELGLDDEPEGWPE